MCGFAGWTGPSRPQQDAAVLQTMGRMLSARGPDEERITHLPQLRWVFRRLAINDLAGGSQPFSLDQGDIITAVNGEIYNHRALAARELPEVTLRGRSDCEVVGHLYRKFGPAFLQHLNGIFAIMLWDARRRTLLLARDRLGVKPLYIARQAQGQLLFASELKALLRHPEAPRGLDWRAFGDLPDEALPFRRPGLGAVLTGIEGVDFVPPAHFVEWREGECSPPRPYWRCAGPDAQDVPPLKDPAFVSAQDCVVRYAELLDESVQRQLMSDVPMGVFLSGGLDSCFITALAARHGVQLDAFTLVEPAITHTGDPAAAARLAALLGLRLHPMNADGDAMRRAVRLDLQALDHLVWVLDFPLFSIELLLKYELHRHLRQVRPDIKVVLLGQGADEFAGGYAALGSSSWTSFIEHEAQALQRTELDPGGVSERLARLLDPALDTHWRPGHPAAAPRPEAVRCEPWQAVRFGDLAAYNLWHEDRLSAAHGTEARVPFLDHVLVEWLCAVPRRLRPVLFFNKAIERLAALSVLPPDLALRPKVPLYGRSNGQGRSLERLVGDWALTAFEDFRQAHLHRPDRLFDPGALMNLHAALLQTSDARLTAGAAHALLRCLCIDSFARQCRAAATQAEPPRWPALGQPASADIPACPMDEVSA